MSTCIECGLEQPVRGRSRCYSCGFIEDERLAVIEARNAEWWADETPMEPCS